MSPRACAWVLSACTFLRQSMPSRRCISRACAWVYSHAVSQEDMCRGGGISAETVPSIRGSKAFGRLKRVQRGLWGAEGSRRLTRCSGPQVLAGR